jgi:hypothetical protein
MQMGLVVGLACCNHNPDLQIRVGEINCPNGARRLGEADQNGQKRLEGSLTI